MSPQKQIVYFLKRLYDRNLTTASGGNISILKNGMMYITPTGKDKASLEEEDISVINLTSGELISGLKPTSEIQMHREIYQNRKDVQSIIHAHPFYTTIFSVIKEPIKINLISEAVIFLKNINYVDYAVPGSERLANLVVKGILDTDILILRNHGALAVGKNCTDCFHKIEVLEFNAKLQYSILGRNDLNVLSKKDLAEIREIYN